MISYIDSSALVKAYCLEPTSRQAIALLKRIKLPILFTLLHALEIRNAIRLKRFRKELTIFQMQGVLQNLQNDLDEGILYLPDLDFRAVFDQAERLSAAHTSLFGVRSLDVLHVSAALVLGCTHFASFDRRQRALARAAGMKVLPA